MNECTLRRPVKYIDHLVPLAGHRPLLNVTSAGKGVATHGPVPYAPVRKLYVLYRIIVRMISAITYSRVCGGFITWSELQPIND